MSSVTKCRQGNRISFRDASGKATSGIVLEIQGQQLLVGVQSASRPYVWAGTERKGKWVANNALWVVPFADVLSASVPDYVEKAAA